MLPSWFLDGPFPKGAGYEVKFDEAYIYVPNTTVQSIWSWKYFGDEHSQQRYHISCYFPSKLVFLVQAIKHYIYILTTISIFGSKHDTHSGWNYLSKYYMYLDVF